MIDYSLYWLLSTIRYHGRKENDTIEGKKYKIIFIYILNL